MEYEFNTIKAFTILINLIIIVYLSVLSLVTCHSLERIFKSDFPKVLSYICAYNVSEWLKWRTLDSRQIYVAFETSC